MRKVEFKKRLRGLGFSLDKFEVEVGLSVTTYRNWVEIPEKYVWWLYWKEAEKRLERIRECLDC